MPIRSEYHSSLASSTPLPAAPSGRGRPKGSSSLKGSKSKSKASASFAADVDKKSQAFENPSVIDPHSVQNVIHTVDEQVINLLNRKISAPKIIRLYFGTALSIFFSFL